MSDPYCYDNGTLRNRFGLTDAEELIAVEVAVTTLRITELETLGLPGRFDLEHLRAIHRRIFGDVYEWAGELRMVDLFKGDTLFCLARFLVPAALDVFVAVDEVRQGMVDSAGVQLDWSTISPDGNVAALVAATRGDNSGFHAALRIAGGQPVDLEHSHWVTLLRER